MPPASFVRKIGLRQRRQGSSAPRATLDVVERDCRDHFDVACARVLKIKPKDASLAPFVLNWPQRYIVERDLQPAFDAKEPLVEFVLKGRQDGLSTLGMGWTFHKIRWYPGITAIAAAHSDATVSNFRDMAQRFHENLPAEMQPPKDRYNRKEIHYLPPLDSSLRVQAAKYLDISRGKTPQIVLLSECAYFPDPETIMAGVLEAVPDYGPTLILMESTAAGIDTWHYDMWQQIGQDAKNQWGRRKWKRRFVPWFWSPDKQMPMPPRWDFPTEDRQEFRDIQKRYKLTDGQIMWRWARFQEYLKTHGHLAKRLLQQEQPCVRGDQRVGSDRGLLFLEAQQQATVTATGNVDGFFQKGEKFVCRLRTAMGYEVVATPDHRIALGGLGEGQWRALRDLVPDELIQLASPRFAEHVYTASWDVLPTVQASVRITEEWGRFLGIFMGDGCYYKNTLSIFCCRDDMDMVEESCRLIRCLFGVEPRTRVVGKKDGGIEVRAGVKAAQALFEHLGLLRRNAAHSFKRRVCVPEAIWSSPASVVREFLRGLFETDGFNAYKIPRVVLFSQYMDFLRDVQLLLLGFGITCKRTSRQAINGQGHRYTANELILRTEEAMAFNVRIGFLSARKQRQLRTELGPSHPNRHSMALEDGVAEVTPEGIATVYDLGIANAHAFDAGGILVHNCSSHEAFITGGECIFPETAMQRLQGQIAPPRQGFEVKRTGTWDMTLIPQPLRDEPALVVWEAPQRGQQYALGVDVSHGVGRDASAIVVVRMPGFVQVAHWDDTHTSTKDLAYVIAAIATWYGKASGDRPICTVELNDAGLHTNLELQELSARGPFQMYIWEYLDRLGAQPVDHRSRTGWVTNLSTKPIMIGVANSLLLAGQCTIPSEALQVDMGRCQEILRRGRSYGETGGCDLTIAWLLAIVTAWRKIARWAFQGQETNRPGQPLLEDNGVGPIPEVFFDRRGQQLLGAAATKSSMRAGSPDIDWRVQ